MLSTILFDWDDTLADTFPARERAVQATFDAVGVTDISGRDFLLTTIGSQLQVELQRFCEKRGIKDDLPTLQRRFYWRDYAGLVTAYPGVSEMLRELRRRGYKLGVVTHKIRERMLEGMHTGLVREVDDLGWRGLFDVLIGMEDMPRLKPDPGGILNALARLRLVPSQALYIGDSASDMQAAFAAPCDFILAAWGAYKPVETPPGGKPLLIAQTPQDVVRLLAGSRP